MAIPMSEIVEVTPRVVAEEGEDAVLSGLILTKEQNIIPADDMVVTFSSQSTLGDYFGEESDLYELAGYYFAGYDNSLSKPKCLVIAQYVGEDDATSAWLRSTITPASLSKYQAVTNGVLNITVDDTEIALTGIDLSSVTAYSDVADTLTTAFNGVATVTYDGVRKQFVVASATTGETSTIGYATAYETEDEDGEYTDLGDLMGLLYDDAPIISTVGLDGMSISANMNAIVRKYANWATFTTEWEPDEDEAIDFATWSSQNNVEYLYFPWDTDANAVTVNDGNLISTVLEAENVGGTAYPIYEGYQDGVASETCRTTIAAMGFIASIDWERANATITLAFKSQEGLAAAVDDETSYENLINNKYNFMGNFATKNAEFVMFYDSGMFGDWKFIDTYINAIWLRDALQLQLANGLAMSPRVPYTERGYNMITSWIQSVVDRALNNGVIDPGVEISELQRQELIIEAGYDISNDLYLNGYVIQVLDPTSTVRQNRGTPVCNLWYTYGGAVQKISLTSTALI